ncbi:hypothetical protein JCM11251_003623 [Rhodosporidiobolus azoricus]
MPPKVQPGNPDWLQWVEDLISKAEERGEKSVQTYKKAAHSLRSCPITFAHPDEALQLASVGPKIVAHLTKKLKEKCEKEGVDMPDRAPSPAKARARKPASAPKSKKRSALDFENEEDDPRFARRMRTGGAADGIAGPSNGGGGGPAIKFHPDGHVWNEVNSEEDEGIGTGASKSKGSGKGKAKALDGAGKEKKDKPYIPRQNSGAYAILLALYRLSSFDDQQAWSTKQRIMDTGQEYSKTPFDTGTAVRAGQVQGGGAFTYSAWSGLSTLTTKSLVQADNKRPCKYSLTPSGYALAEKLAPSASIPLHQPTPSTSSSAGGPPSSSASLGSGRRIGSGAGHPSSSNGLSGRGGDTWSALGRGTVLGGPGSGIRPPSGIHPAAPRRRERTPPLFLEPEPEPDEDHAFGGEGDDDPEFRQQLRQALALSRRESLSVGLGSSSPAASLGGAAGRDILDPAAVARRAAGAAALARTANGGGSRGLPSSGGGGGGGGLGMDGRRAASGLYAVSAGARPAKEAPTGGGIKNVDSAFGYFYLDEGSNRTTSRSLAEVSQTDDGSQMLYRIEYRAAQDLHPIVRGLVRPKLLIRSEGDVLPGGLTKEAFIKERVSNEVAPGYPEAVMRKHSGGVEKGHEKVDKGKGKEKERDPDPVRSLLAGFKAPEKRSRDAMYAPPKEVRRLGADPDAAPTPPGPIAAAPTPAASTSSSRPTVSATVSRSTSATSTSASTSSARPSVSLSPAQSRPSASSILASAPRLPAAAASTSSSAPLFASFDAPPSRTADGLIVNRHPLDPVRDIVVSSSYTPPSFSPTVWPAGSFKVFLVVDSREGTREAGKRVELCEKMEQLGVPVERRMLPLGDMLWVAKRWDYERNRPVELRAVGPQGGGGGDAVLDAIVERKRLDDLCSSIIDGRYVGQKFRYKDSGISHRIYLIEKYDAAQHYEKFGKQIWTCKSQLQVNDGFYVHESANIADTINYLKKRTQVMQELYEASPLHLIPDDVLDRPTYLSLQNHLRTLHPSIRYLTNYAAFCELNRTDSALTLRSQWASMIQRVNGVSAEKAVQFLGRWETPWQFYEEAKAHERAVEDENAQLDRMEQDVVREGKKAKKPAKRRKVEDFVIEELEKAGVGGGTRDIKGKVGGRIWELFMTRGKYPVG